MGVCVNCKGFERFGTSRGDPNICSVCGTEIKKQKRYEELEKKLLKNKNVKKITVAVRRKIGY